ncbi:uncharacterized protein LOC124313215 [Daphnia pulicaria]|uniref:uncharacterized protein LOC124313215 n=1 Tax=Daphnia pulicaria TaxID=35523 RepID=UPI001EE9F3C7|nr:uncharacterized protein LOC124313215 [Daphnia pulicaria]
MADMSAFVPKKMAEWERKVDHLIWQIEVTSDEKWEELTKLQGLIVVDVYSEWCGPCTAMATYLKEIKLLLGDDFLHCALAKADCISQLEKFRGRSEPTWLFLAGGEPVVLIRGANAPLIRKTLFQELQTEKEVLEGTRQRVTISWDSIDLPVVKPENENYNNALLTTAPDNWWELDGLTLQGSYPLIIDKLMEGFVERNLEIVATSAVQVDKKDCLILWFPTYVDYLSLSDWFEHKLKTLIAEVEPKKVIIKPARDEDELEEQIEGLNLEDLIGIPDDNSPVIEIDPEVSDYEPIQYRLISDPDEKDSLIKRISKRTTEDVESSVEVDEDEEIN